MEKKGTIIFILSNRFEHPSKGGRAIPLGEPTPLKCLFKPFLVSLQEGKMCYNIL